MEKSDEQIVAMPGGIHSLLQLNDTAFPLPDHLLDVFGIGIQFVAGFARCGDNRETQVPKMLYPLANLSISRVIG